MCEPRAVGEENLRAGPVFPHPAGLPEEQCGHRTVQVAICLAGERSCLVLVSLMWGPRALEGRPHGVSQVDLATSRKTR